MAGNDHRDQSNAPTSEPGCQAGPLKDALDQLAERIAEADRRNTAVLRELQDRVVALGDRANAARAALPPRYAAAFERVEDAMAALADRLGDTEADRVALPHAAADPMVGRQFRDADVDAPPATVADEATREVRRAMGRYEPQGHVAPPALRSAMSAAADGDWVRVEPPGMHDRGHEQTAPEDDALWAPQTADALASHYHDPAPEPQLAADQWPTMHRDEPAAPVDRFAAAPLAAHAAGSAAIERTWLEDKLAEVAERVEHSLADINPHNSFLAIGERFDQLEQRFGTALDDVATRHDLEGLRLVENQIGELFSHLDRTQAQLGRLDAIEGQLEDLRARLSDEHLSRLAGGEGPNEEHMLAIADAAAERVAQQMDERLSAFQPMAASHQVSDGGSDAAIADLAGMLQDYMSERRSGDANAAEALDTLQQAMQQLLDRLEALESAQVQPAATAHAHPAPHLHIDAPAMPASHPRATQHFEEPTPPRAASAGPRSVVEEARAAARAASAVSGAGSRPTLQVAEDDIQSEPPREFARRTTAPAVDHAENGAVWTQSNGESDRKAFIAMARRAAERASNGAAPAAASVTAEDEIAPAASSLRQRISNIAGSKSSAPGDKAASRGIRPSVFMVASLAAFALAGYWLISGSKFRSMMPGVGIERRAPTASPVRTKAPAGLPQKAPTQGPASAEPDAGTAPVEGEGPAAPRQRGNDKHEELGGTPGAAPERSSSLDLGTEGGIFERGITVDGGSREVDPNALERARRQVEVASQSTRLGHQLAAQGSPAIHTAAARELREAISGEVPAPATATAADTRGARAIEMPPATIAPLSVRMAASKGDAAAQLEIATRFAEGKGVSQDFGQAAIWYQRAAAQGLPAAQYRLAALYERGLGVEADGARARLWYKRAAEQGNVRAMHNLAVLSASRAGGSPDYPAAVQWFTEAAKRGLADSQYNLGILNESGLGVPKNSIDAYKWYSLAARSGDKEAIRRRDAMKAKMQPADLRAADAQVISWRALPIEGRANDTQAASAAWRGRTQVR